MARKGLRRWYNDYSTEEGDHQYDSPLAKLLDQDITDNSNLQLKQETGANNLSEPYFNREGFLAAEDIIVEGVIVERDKTEQKMVHCFLRSMLSAFHMVMALIAGFFSVYSLLDWDFHCLPSMVDHSGKTFQFENGLPTLCNSVVYAMCSICILNLLMCLVLNLMWKRPCVEFFHLLLCTAYLAISVLGGALMTVYYMMWCDSLEQYDRSQGGSGLCTEAAKRYISKDEGNMTMAMYQTRMEVKQITIWALFPLSLFAAITYALLIQHNRHVDEVGEVPNGQFRYVVMHDESTPLSRDGPNGRPPTPRSYTNQSLNGEVNNASTNPPENL